MDVSVIYVNYHTSGLIADSMRSLLHHTSGVSYEVIVVDNGSQPDLPEILAQAVPEQPVRCVMLKENRGFGVANNEGFCIATGRNLFCLNPDTLLLNNAVKILSDRLDTHPGTGAVGGNLYDAEMRPALSYRRIFPGIRWEINDLLHLWPEKLRYGASARFNAGDTPLDVAYISGADLMMPRHVVELTGGFSPDFFMYFEETDLCRRIRRAGYRITSVPQARIQHLEGASFAQEGVNRARISRAEKGRITYLRRNLAAPGRMVAQAIYELFLWSRAKLRGSEAYSFRIAETKRLKQER